MHRTKIREIVGNLNAEFGEGSFSFTFSNSFPKISWCNGPSEFNVRKYFKGYLVVFDRSYSYNVLLPYAIKLARAASIPITIRPGNMHMFNIHGANLKALAEVEASMETFKYFK